jgi:hypothetical protein
MIAVQIYIATAQQFLGRRTEEVAAGRWRNKSRLENYHSCLWSRTFEIRSRGLHSHKSVSPLDRYLIFFMEIAELVWAPLAVYFLSLSFHPAIIYRISFCSLHIRNKKSQIEYLTIISDRLSACNNSITTQEICSKFDIGDFYQN